MTNRVEKDNILTIKLAVANANRSIARKDGGGTLTLKFADVNLYNEYNDCFSLSYSNYFFEYSLAISFKMNF